jgi:Lrp/AsnC family transcriptional regulator, leucine-responsive regulatory protein
MRIPELDGRDRAILAALQDNGRLSNAELADKVNLSASACLRRTRLLEESGLVAGYTMLLDQRACGKPGNAFVFVSLDQQGRQTLNAFEEAVADIGEIMECYLLAGQADYLVRVIYQDAEDFERIHTDILTRLPGVVRVQTTLTLRTVKKTTRIEV